MNDRAILPAPADGLRSENDNVIGDLCNHGSLRVSASGLEPLRDILIRLGLVMPPARPANDNATPQIIQHPRPEDAEQKRDRPGLRSVRKRARVRRKSRREEGAKADGEQGGQHSDRLPVALNKAHRSEGAKSNAAGLDAAKDRCAILLDRGNVDGSARIIVHVADADAAALHEGPAPDEVADLASKPGASLEPGKYLRHAAPRNVDERIADIFHASITPGLAAPHVGATHVVVHLSDRLPVALDKRPVLEPSALTDVLAGCPVHRFDNQIVADKAHHAAIARAHDPVAVHVADPDAIALYEHHAGRDMLAGEPAQFVAAKQLRMRATVEAERVDEIVLSVSDASRGRLVHVADPDIVGGHLPTLRHTPPEVRLRREDVGNRLRHASRAEQIRHLRRERRIPPRVFPKRRLFRGGH